MGYNEPWATSRNDQIQDMIQDPVIVQRGNDTSTNTYASDRATIAHINVREKPRRRLVVIMHTMAVSMIGFLPNLSDAQPHAIAVKA